MRTALLCAVWCAAIVGARYSSGELHQRLDKHVDGWWYLDKFSYGLGKGELRAEFDIAGGQSVAKRLQNEGSVLALYLDTEWPEVLKAKTCEEKLALARQKPRLSDFRYEASTLGVTISEKEDEEEDEDDEEEEERERGRQSLVLTRNLQNSLRPHYWYVAWVQCYGDKRVEEGRYSLTFTQAGGSHTSADDQGMLQTYAVVLAAFTVGGMFYCRQLQALAARDYGAKLPVSAYVIACSVALQAVAVLAEVCHLLLYARNGGGVWLLEALSEVCAVLSHIVLTRVLMSFARGLDLADDLRWHAGWWVLLALVAVHVLLALTTTFTADGHDDYHDHHTWPRAVLMLLRLCVCGYFMMKIQEQYERAGPLAPALQLFFYRLGIGVCLWFLSTPICLMISFVFADYWQNAFITTSVLIIQSCAMAGVAWLSLQSDANAAARGRGKYL